MSLFWYVIAAFRVGPFAIVLLGRASSGARYIDTPDFSQRLKKPVIPFSGLHISQNSLSFDSISVLPLPTLHSRYDKLKHVPAPGKDEL